MRRAKLRFPDIESLEYVWRRFCAQSLMAVRKSQILTLNPIFKTVLTLDLTLDFTLELSIDLTLDLTLDFTLDLILDFDHVSTVSL